MINGLVLLCVIVIGDFNIHGASLGRRVHINEEHALGTSVHYGISVSVSHVAGPIVCPCLRVV